MKAKIKLFTALLIAVLFCSQSIFAESGVMTMKVKTNTGTKDMAMKMTMSFTEKKIAMKFLEGPQETMAMMQGMKVVVNNEEKMIYTMMNMGGKPFGMKMDMTKMDAMAGAKSKSKPIVLKKTGKKMKVAGHNCEEYIGENEDMSVKLYATKEINIDAKKFYKGVMSSSKMTSSGANYEMYDNVEGFPVLSTVTMLKSNTVVDTEITDVKLGPVADSEFSIEGYEFMDVSSMMPQDK